MEKRVIAGLASLPISAVIALIAVFLMGNPIIPFIDAEMWVDAVNGPFYIIAQMVYIFVHLLLIFGFWALYRYLSGFKGAEVLSFWGFLFSMWGIVLVLPIFGVFIYISPQIAEFYSEGNTTLTDVINRAVTMNSIYFGIPAAIFYTTGTLLFGSAIFKTGFLPKIIAFIIVPHGLLAALGVTSTPLLLLAWLTLFASGFSITYYSILRSEEGEEDTFEDAFEDEYEDDESMM